MTKPTPRASWRLIPLLVWIAMGAPAAMGAENLLVNGDFEREPNSAPPPGWTMWGPQKDKDPARYTRDPSQSHGGKASFRIHHPAHTGGYIVSSPETALRPQPSTRYVVSFWARAERPARARFGWEAHREIRPFIAAPSLPANIIEVDQTWRPFHFVVDEGWDFFAEECRYLLLSFNAVANPSAEGTLWIDDVVVTPEPSPREGRLVNPATLDYQRLNQPLRPGDRLEITVDAARKPREAPREVGGISFHRVVGWTGTPYNREGEYTLPPEHEEAIRQLRLPMTRFYGVGDEPFGLEGAIDRAAEFTDRVGIPHAAIPLELENQEADSQLAPEVWAAAARHSVARGYGFKRWEVANEPYIAREDSAFPTPDSYLEHFLVVSRAVRAAQPDAQIGLAINPKSARWGNELLLRAAGHYDFVVAHYYDTTDVNRESFEEIVLGANDRQLDLALSINGLMRRYNPDRDVYQYDTEWGMHSDGPNGESVAKVHRNGNIFGMTHRAARLVYYLREGMLRGASSWEMFTFRRSPGFAILVTDAPRARSMFYWLYYYFNRHVGRWVVDLEGSAPYVEGEPAGGGKPWRVPQTPVVATLGDDGRQLFLILINGSWTKPAPCSIALRNFPAKQAEGVMLTHPDPDASPIVERKEDLVHDFPVKLADDRIETTLPPHCVVFLTLSR